MQISHRTQPVDTLPSIEKPSKSLDACGLTDVGRVRHTNEDAYLIATLQRSIVVHDASPAGRGWFPGEAAGTLLVVADGMGGQGGGDVASRVAVSTVSSYLLNWMPWGSAGQAQRGSLPGVRDQLSSAVVAGDETVRRTGAKSGAPRMGTTLTMALVLGVKLYVAHVGDSRCYLLRAGALRRLTTDHTMAQRVAEASHEPLAPDSQLHHILWNALGATEDAPQPEIVKLPLEPSDLILVCSDGLTKHVTDAEIAAVLGSPAPLAERCKILVGRANAGGGTDNVTVVVARAPSTNGHAASPSA
ncbi:MAG TPA: protein phosphatase 2C domain-containing protein [Polyangiaceae bacterium]|nr:protein phosphatase 2C domain-containing protein [Polyangiaceae bacterium]